MALRGCSVTGEIPGHPGARIASQGWAADSGPKRQMPPTSIRAECVMLNKGPHIGAPSEFLWCDVARRMTQHADKTFATHLGLQCRGLRLAGDGLLEHVAPLNGFLPRQDESILVH